MKALSTLLVMAILLCSCGDTLKPPPEQQEALSAVSYTEPERMETLNAKPTEDDFNQERNDIVSDETAKQHAKEKLGYLGGRIGGFDYDEKLELIVLTMYDEPSDYFDEAILLRQNSEGMENYCFEKLKKSYPNYFLAVYDMDGNFVKYFPTNIPVRITGKDRTLKTEAVSVDNGMAWYDSERATPYIVEQPHYIVDKNKVYWHPIEEYAPQNILCWYDFEKETVGEMTISDEWGELVYAFNGSMIFKNTETGGCYKSDMRGEILDKFICKDVIGMNKARWNPLPDFSGVIYNMDNHESSKTFLWKRENGLTATKELNNWYNMKATVLKNGKILLKSAYQLIPDIVNTDDGKLINIAKDIAKNYPDKFIAETKPHESHLRIKEKQNQIMQIERFLYSDMNTAWVLLNKKTGSNYQMLYCLSDSRLIELTPDYFDNIIDGQFFVKNNTLCSLELVEGTFFCHAVDLDTAEQKSISTDLPTDCDTLRVVTVTDSGKVILAGLKHLEWKIFSIDVKI